MPAIRVPGTASAPELDAHLAVPAVGDGPWPGVVVLQEILGLTDDLRQIADRFASAGYLAVAPDLYTAGGGLRCVRGVLAALSRGAGPAVQDVLAVRDWLVSRPDCTGRTGVVGFCLGGGFALLCATRGFDVAAPYYGPLPSDTDALAGACPVVASYGARDRGLPGAAARLQQALQRHGVEHDVTEYPAAGHSFANRHGLGPWFGPLERVAGLAFDQDASEDSWRRVLSAFDRHLQRT